MKKFMIIMATALLAACGGDETEPKKAVEVSTSEQPNIMTYIPSDSPVLITSGLNPSQYPSKYIEVMQNNMDNAVKYIEIVLKQAMEKASSQYQEVTDTENDEATENKAAEAQQKVMKFVDKWLVQDKFNKIGFKVGETQFAMYLVDLLPVIRIQLSQGHQIEAMLTEMQQEFELPITVSDANGIKVRELNADKMAFMIATHDDYLVLSLAPSVLKDQMVNQLVGAEKPAKSLAQDPSIITQIKQAHQFTTDDLLLVDFQALADYFLYPNKYNSKFVNFMQIDENMLSAVCKDEITAMIANAPRMVAGSQELTNDTIKGAFIWEMDQSIAQDMAKMAGRIPHGNKDAAFAFGMSFDIVSSKEVATKYVNKLVESPYQCEHFAPLNLQASDLQAKLSQPIPPFVGNFKGFNFSMDDLVLDLANVDMANPNPKEIIKSLKTQLFLSVDKTDALLGMAQMMVPQLQNMEVNTDGSLITLADKVPLVSGKDIPLDISELYAAISSDTIGISMGHEGGGDLSAKVKAEGQNALMSFSANADGYRAILEQVFAMAEMPNMPASLKEELSIQKDLTLSMLYWKSQDMTMSFNDQGFVTAFDIKY